MTLSLKLQTRVVMITVVLMLAAVAVRAQSGISSVGGSVANAAATNQGKFVVIAEAKVELEQNVGNSPRKFTTTTDKQGVCFASKVLSHSQPGFSPVVDACLSPKKPFQRFP